MFFSTNVLLVLHQTKYLLTAHRLLKRQNIKVKIKFCFKLSASLQEMRKIFSFESSSCPGAKTVRLELDHLLLTIQY